MLPKIYMSPEKVQKNHQFSYTSPPQNKRTRDNDLRMQKLLQSPQSSSRVQHRISEPLYRRNQENQQFQSNYKVNRQNIIYEHEEEMMYNTPLEMTSMKKQSQIDLNDSPQKSRFDIQDLPKIQLSHIFQQIDNIKDEDYQQIECKKNQQQQLISNFFHHYNSQNGQILNLFSSNSTFEIIGQPIHPLAQSIQALASVIKTLQPDISKVQYFQDSQNNFNIISIEGIPYQHQEQPMGKFTMSFKFIQNEPLIQDIKIQINLLQ